jgi:hypothetical protein
MNKNAMRARTLKPDILLYRRPKRDAQGDRRGTTPK